MTRPAALPPNHDLLLLPVCRLRSQTSRTMSDQKSTLQGSPRSVKLDLPPPTTAIPAPAASSAADQSSSANGGGRPALASIPSDRPAHHAQPDNAYPLTSAPTLKDLRANAAALQARRTRSRTMSMSSNPREAALGRALSRVTSPCVALSNSARVSPFVSVGGRPASALQASRRPRSHSLQRPPR